MTRAKGAVRRLLIRWLRAAGGAAHRAEFQLRVVQQRQSPAVDEWARSVKKRIADGTIRAEVDRQPPVREVIREYLESCV